MNKVKIVWLGIFLTCVSVSLIVIFNLPSTTILHVSPKESGSKDCSSWKDSCLLLTAIAKIRSQNEKSFDIYMKNPE